MDDEEENTENRKNRKPISYSTEFRLDMNLNNFVRNLCPAMVNVFQETFCYTLHLFKQDYSLFVFFVIFVIYSIFVIFVIFCRFL